MVGCAIVGCSNSSKKKKKSASKPKCSFYKLPGIIQHQGQQMLEISSERRRAWLRAISRDDLTEEQLANNNVWVCERHFVTSE